MYLWHKSIYEEVNRLAKAELVQEIYNSGYVKFKK